MQELTVNPNQQNILDLLRSEDHADLFLFEFGFSHSIKQPLEEVKKELNTLVEIGIVSRSSSIIEDEYFVDEELDEDDEDFYQYSELSEQLGETVEGWTTTYGLSDEYKDYLDRLKYEEAVKYMQAELDKHFDNKVFIELVAGEEYYNNRFSINTSTTCLLHGAFDDYPTIDLYTENKNAFHTYCDYTKHTVYIPMIKKRLEELK